MADSKEVKQRSTAQILSRNVNRITFHVESSGSHRAQSARKTDRPDAGSSPQQCCFLLYLSTLINVSVFTFARRWSINQGKTKIGIETLIGIESGMGPNEVVESELTSRIGPWSPTKLTEKSLYTVLGIAQSGAALDAIPKNVDDTSRIFVLSVIIVSILNYAVTFVLSAFLLIGVLWENIKFMRPWIVWFTFQTICYVALFVFFTTIQMINHSNDTPLLIYLIEFLILVIRIYMVILVVSYHKQIKEELHQHKQLEKFVDNEFYYYSI
ncbi:hypothetical protein EVAR_81206_1 [Eumeta japonica]|uniref:Uncharacterized protein n=1 Tax=Eumeta variegata TaxID=151549 RepID=A0A4C1V1K9_EUMVA|nr:hypothetical protein EVAR_81206_1 [Eumeta japonica]